MSYELHRFYLMKELFEDFETAAMDKTVELADLRWSYEMVRVPASYPGCQWLMAPAPTMLKVMPEGDQQNNNLLVAQTLAAFSHFVWVVKKGHTVHTNFSYMPDGTNNALVVGATTHHDRDEDEAPFPRNEGAAGLKDFKDMHVCNHVCKGLELQGLDTVS
ncbi:hypothetical protein JB92DRAFT_242917 [Gautieria morchelliformis]|nr:hypothetical protein JB92DRAFT_242917 [Gautieria morchelliformis]